MSADLHIVSLAAVTWDFPLVGRTRMLTEAWLDLGQPTTFVQSPSLRTASQRLRWGASSAAPPVVRPWPTFPSAIWTSLSFEQLDASARAQAKRLRRLLSAHLDWSRSVALVVSPVWTPWLDELPFAKVVYDCIDDLGVHVPRPELTAHYRRWEDQLVRRCDAAVVTADELGSLLQQRRAGMPITTIRNGVGTDRFRAALRRPRPGDVPKDRPVIGFVGALYAWIDWSLVEAAARAMPDCAFVMVGPWDAQAPIERIRALGNVTFLGARRYDDVPDYVAAFDVCWVPFDQSRVSTLANPVKIYEYLALGKPVVTTPVADTSSFDGLALVGRTHAEVIARLRQSLQHQSHAEDDRVSFARANDWRVRAQDYIHFAQALLEPAACPASPARPGAEALHAARSGSGGNPA